MKATLAVLQMLNSKEICIGKANIRIGRNFNARNESAKEINDIIAAVTEELRGVKEALNEIKSSIVNIQAVGDNQCFDSRQLKSWCERRFPDKLGAIIDKLPLLKSLRYACQCK